MDTTGRVAAYDRWEIEDHPGQLRELNLTSSDLTEREMRWLLDHSDLQQRFAELVRRRPLPASTTPNP